LVNSALQKMPKYEGELYRGTGLTDVQQAVYKEGNIVEERSLTSTSKTKGWSGNTQYTITAIGQRGSDITNLSYHPGEGEVLFSARTFFRVDKVEGKPGGNMRVWMTEMPKDLTDAAI
jgi:hypothetical protein